MCRTSIFVLAAVSCLLAPSGPVKADVATAVADTFVTVHGGLGGSASIHGTDSTLGIIGALGSQATPLIEFDLSGWNGRQVIGDAEMDLYLVSSWNNATCTQTIELHEEHSDWSETATDWSNLPGPNWWVTPPGPYGQMGSAVLDSQGVTCVNGQPRHVLWTIPGSVVQAWIGAPANNHGVVLVSQTSPTYQDLWFSSREGVSAPRLTFSTVPEPSMAVLLGGAGCLLVCAHARRRKGKQPPW